MTLYNTERALAPVGAQDAAVSHQSTCTHTAASEETANVEWRAFLRKLLELPEVTL